MAKPGITVITCTKRPECMIRLLANFNRQKYGKKELIIILNHDSLKLSAYRKAAAPYRNVRVYRLPEHITLGSCLNFGVQRSKYGCIAKFDDDDYYAPGYLAEAMRAMLKTGADIVGKRAHFMHLLGRRALLYRYENKANREVRLVQGATLLVNRRVFGQVRFPDRNRGECVKFCADSIAKGYRIYSTSPYHFLARRRQGSRNHTWIVSDRELLSRSARLLKVKRIYAYVRRAAGG